MAVFKNMDKVEVSNDKKTWYPATFIGPFNGEFVVLRDLAFCGSITRWPHCRHIRPDWPVDHPIQVRGSEKATWKNRHFSGWDSNGYAKAWKDGTTKHSATCLHVKEIEVSWPYWREVPDQEG